MPGVLELQYCNDSKDAALENCVIWLREADENHSSNAGTLLYVLSADMVEFDIKNGEVEFVEGCNANENDIIMKDVS